MNIMRVFDQFPAQGDCLAYLEQARWGGKPICPYCGSANTTRNQHRHRCYDYKTSFSVTVGTNLSPYAPTTSEVVLSNHAHVERQERTIRTTAFSRLYEDPEL